VTFTWRDTSLGSRDPCYPYLFCTEQVGDWTLYCIVAADWSVGVCVCTTALIQQGFCEETYFREVFFLIRNPLRNAFKDVSQAKILFQNGSWFCVRHPKGGGTKFAPVRVPRSCSFVILLTIGWRRSTALGNEGFENLSWTSNFVLFCNWKTALQRMWKTDFLLSKICWKKPGNLM